MGAHFVTEQPLSLLPWNEVDQYLARLLARGLSVSLVIPTLDEEANLRRLLPTLPTVCELVVVDGDSSDCSVDLVEQMRPDAIILQQPARGKGDALLCGFHACSGDIIVTLDADGSTDASELPVFIDALLGGADFAKGSRAIGGSADLTRVRSLGNRALVTVFNLVYQRSYTDLCYGYNAFWRRCLHYMSQTAGGFEIETQMHAWMAVAPVQVVEVPSFELPRNFGTSRLRPLRDGLRILRVILKERMIDRSTRETVIDLRPRPLRVEHTLPATATDTASA